MEQFLENVATNHADVIEAMASYESLVIDYVIKNKSKIKRGSVAAYGYTIELPEILTTMAGTNPRYIATFKPSVGGDFFSVVINEYYEFEFKADDERFWSLMEIFTSIGMGAYEVYLKGSSTNIEMMKKDLDNNQ